MPDPILSKALPCGQWRKGPGAAIAREWRLCVAVALLSALAPAWAQGAAAAAPVPGLAPGAAPGPSHSADTLRYAALKVAPVNARGGPGEDYKALWTFQAKGAPVQIVEESGDWRRVCDPEGGLAWVRARALDNRRRVMRVSGGDLAMRRAPSADAKVAAMLAPRATAELLASQGDWRRISVDHATGWVRAKEVWGAVDAPQCK